MRHIGILAAFGLAAAGSAQELWHTGTPADMYGIYFLVPMNLQAGQGGRFIDQTVDGRRVGFQAPNLNSETKQETLVGRVEASCKDVVYNDLACHHYTSTYVVQGQRNTPLRSVQRKVESWVDFKGVVRRVHTFYRDDRKAVEIDAKFGKDEIEMEITENGKKRSATMNPVQGVAAFNSPIEDMIKNADKDRKERLWCMIDPATGGIIQYTLRITGRFVPPAGSTSKIKGFNIEVKAPVGIHTMYVGEDAQLRQIDFADTSIVRAVYTRPIGGG